MQYINGISCAQHDIRLVHLKGPTVCSHNTRVS
jgi:hypothetical protein